MSLDHLILLSKPSRLDDTVDQLSAWFTVVEGGTHVPPVTANSLVPLPSGTYLELIHFLAPPADDSIHWWAKKLPGHIDWCLLGEPTQNQRQAVKDVQPDRDGWEYAEGVRGGRTRPDGQEVQWSVTFPGQAQGRGGVPFFCRDHTDRTLRVPALPSPHPSKVMSISHITLLTASTHLDTLSAYLVAVLGPSSASKAGEIVFRLPEPNALPAEIPEAKVVLRTPQTEEEYQYLSDRGPHAFLEIGFYTERDGGKEGLELLKGGGGSRWVFRRV